jgi:hypothetical protein
MPIRGSVSSRTSSPRSGLGLHLCGGGGAAPLRVRPAAPPRRAQARHLAKVLAWSVRLGSRAAVRSHCLQRSRSPGGARVEPARGARSRVRPGSRAAIQCRRLRSSRPLGAARVEPDRRSSVPGSETNTLTQSTSSTTSMNGFTLTRCLLLYVWLHRQPCCAVTFLRSPLSLP